MYQFPIGVMLESFRLPTPEALEKAVAIGAKGIQMYATTGEHAPENMNTAQRRELLDMLRAHGLCFSALCGDLGPSQKRSANLSIPGCCRRAWRETWAICATPGCNTHSNHNSQDAHFLF